MHLAACARVRVRGTMATTPAIESMNPEWVDLFDERAGEILDGPADMSRRTR